MGLLYVIICNYMNGVLLYHHPDFFFKSKSFRWSPKDKHLTAEKASLPHNDWHTVKYSTFRTF